MGVVKFTNQTLQTLGFFDGIQIFTLDVFNQRERECVFVIDLFDEYGYFGQSCDARRAVAAFARDDFITLIANRAHDNRLHQALLFDGVRQFIERGLVHVAARLVFTRLQYVAREHRQLPCWVFVQLGVVCLVECIHAVRTPEQCVDTAPQAFFVFRCHDVSCLQFFME